MMCLVQRIWPSCLQESIFLVRLQSHMLISILLPDPHPPNTGRLVNFAQSQQKHSQRFHIHGFKSSGTTTTTKTLSKSLLTVQKDPDHFFWRSCEVKKQHEYQAPFDGGGKAVKNYSVRVMPTACNINTSSIKGPSGYNVFLISISLFTLHVLFGYLIPPTIKLDSFSTFVARCIDSSPVYCIYCKRGYCR